MINKQPAAFLVQYIEKTITNIVSSGFQFNPDISAFSALLNDFVDTCEIPPSQHIAATNTLTQKYASLISYLYQYESLGLRFIQRTAFHSYVDIIDNSIGNFFTNIVSDLSVRYHDNQIINFHDLVIDVGCNHPIMLELSSIISKYFFPSSQVSIGGQVKLHPPGIHDVNSTKWHFDGNPNCMKIIIMLEDAVDGNFQYKTSTNSLRNLSYSPLSCISTVDNGFSSYANLSGPTILNPLVRYLPNLDYQSICTVPTFKGSTVFFHGASILHKGGLNTLQGRPIFQGMLSLS